MTTPAPAARRHPAWPRVQGTSPAAQQARRRQIMGAAIALVLREGYEGLQMRQVAASAHVSTRTLYNHFPSKEHLLLAALIERGQALEQFRNGPPPGRSPAKRVRQCLAIPTQALQALPDLAGAMAKALVCGEASIVPILIEFRDAMIDAIAIAIRPGGPTEADRAVARVVQRIWFAALLAWCSGVEAAESVSEAVDEAVAMLVSAGGIPAKG
ncbi:MAG: TetR/AcrR family transcriptional regulator [Acidimicrobiales bacterium]